MDGAGRKCFSGSRSFSFLVALGAELTLLEHLMLGYQLYVQYNTRRHLAKEPPALFFQKKKKRERLF